MLNFRLLLALVVAACLTLPSVSTFADAEIEGVVVTSNGEYASLYDAIMSAREGDTINVYGGVYDGPIHIDKSVSLIGHDWPVIDGQDAGTVLKMTADGTSLSGFVVRNSGDVLDQENSGIAVEATNVVIEGNRFEDTLFGIYLKKAHGSAIRDNVIESKALDLARRGDPIRVWYSNDVLIENNEVIKGRDVVLWYSERLVIRNNDVSGGRYGLHFMYCDDATITGNRLVKNSVGAFLMYSRRLKLQNNFIAQNRGPSGFGVGMKDMDNAYIADNLFMDNRVGASIDNSPREIDSTVRFEGNVMSYNDIGVYLMPSVKRNEYTGNSFKDNGQQVSVGGGGELKGNSWTVDGVGNYWSDYVGFDANHDGIGDLPYKSQRLFEDLMDRHSSLRLFVYSPAAQSVDFAARAMPMVRPKPKMSDSAPLMEVNMPVNLPESQSQTGLVIGLASAGLLLGSAGLLALPRLPIGRVLASGKAREFAESDIISVNGITKRFGDVVAVDDLSIRIAPGESVAFWGSNGAGKTTVLRCILGLLTCEGSVNVGGFDLKEDSKATRRLIGFVPQHLSLHEDLGVSETMRFYARLKKAPEDRIDEVLERMGLLEHRSKQVGQLSGGMKQRLALALALLSDPPILILDEPTASLDAQSRSAFLREITALKNEGKTLVFASHRVGDIRTLADRVIVLEGGRLVADCDPEELAGRIDENVTLRIYVPIETLDAAANLLKANGFETSRNGSAVTAQVRVGEKGKPISLLTQAGIYVRDFEVELTS